ncbi:MAG: nicotinamide mononucleotide transporter [Oscillospiraceae bacterium]|jgi:nicotinamide riboside transporter PnuC|nr:nicotinamide mononucleotide transporter [Oscillospiraceae bacterium]
MNSFDYSWLLAMLSITGTIFNVKKKVICFYLWAIGEVFWIMLDFKNSCYGRVFLDTVHFGMAVWGIYDWQIRSLRNLKMKTKGLKN